MLETEEVDQDYFTSAASTSLANIFDNTSNPEEVPGNSSLKYTAPKAQVAKASQEEKVALFPIFRCLVDGHQWVNNIYTAIGKLGCSILKVIKDPQKEGALIMVLYDSKVKQNEFISFYESKDKIWSLYGSQDDVKKILEHFKSKNVQLNYSQTESSPTDTKIKQTDEKSGSSATESEELGSKTKASILSRMANMGKSVFPHPTASNKDITSSSSSDDDRNVHQMKLDRNVKIKETVPKMKKKMIKTDPDKHMIPIGKHSDEESTHDNDDLLLKMIQNTKSCSSTASNSMDLFLAEQRINNSELRININRVNDKVDKLLTKVNDLELKSQNDGSNINSEILQKLLKEYESKNKMYEEMLRQKSSYVGTCSESENLNAVNLLAIGTDNNTLDSKIKELEDIIKERDDKILMLSNNVEKLLDNEFMSTEEKDYFLKKISDIDKLSVTNNEMLQKLTKQNVSNDNDLVSNQIKSIMNDTFHGIVENFDQAQKYSGEQIKDIVEKVIKRVTISSLKNLRPDE